MKGISTPCRTQRSSHVLLYLRKSGTNSRSNTDSPKTALANWLPGWPLCNPVHSLIPPKFDLSEKTRLSGDIRKCSKFDTPQQRYDELVQSHLAPLTQLTHAHEAWLETELRQAAAQASEADDGKRSPCYITPTRARAVRKCDDRRNPEDFR